MLATAFWEDRNKDPVVKYAPGDEIPDHHPKRDWLLRSKIAVVVEESVKADAGKPKPTDSIDDQSVEDQGVDDTVVESVEESADSAADTSGEEDKPSEVKPAAGKPKPTDSIDDHRAYLKARKIETKGLTRAQMIKVIAGLED